MNGARNIVGWLLIAGLAPAHAASANLLHNGDFELTSADVFYDGFDPTLADDVTGWTLFLGSADGSYVLVNGVGSSNVGVDMGNGSAGGGLQTAFSSRPAVVAGDGYAASVTYDNYFAPVAPGFFIEWFDGGGSLLSSTGGSLGDPNGPFNYDPYNQLFTLSGIAPAGAATAGVRWFSASPGYAGLAVDNFTFSPVPIPAAAWLLLSGIGGIAALTRRRKSAAPAIAALSDDLSARK